MRIGSLFSGIGGLELGLERAIPNATTLWQIELNPYARRVLAKHWPNARRYDDIQTTDPNELPPVDLICGGFPCQDISRQNPSKAGVSGRKSGLWAHYVRFIRGLRPRFVVVENVANLRTRGLGTVLGDLAACGYDAIWDCIPAAAVGAPHFRDRLFIIAYPNVQRRKEQRVTISTQAGFPRIERSMPWPPEPAICRVANGIPHRVDRLRCLGNAVVPQVAEHIGRIVHKLNQQ